MLKALEGWHPGYHGLVERHGARRFSGLAGLSAHRVYRSIRKDGPSSTTSRCRNIAGVCCWRRRKKTERKVNFRRAHFGEPAWQEVPGEHTARCLRRLVVIQGDTEPASVEQQRHLGTDRAIALRSAQPVPGQRRGGPPSVGDGLSAAKIFWPRWPRGGRRFAAPPLRRCRFAPRMLGAFNEATPDWLSFFMFTFFTDRDGKMQLRLASRSPASIRCRAPAASC